VAVPQLQGWQQQVLAGVKAPVTPQNLQFLNAWAQAEGGSAANNPFNTTQSAPGATSYNSVGVRNFVSPAQGVQATIDTLNNGNYANILGALRNGSSAMSAAQAVANSPWGTGQGVVNVLGGSVPQPGGATPSMYPPQAAVPGASPRLPTYNMPPAPLTPISTSLPGLTPSGLLSQLQSGGDLTQWLINQNMNQNSSDLGGFRATPIQQAQAKGVKDYTTPSGTQAEVQGKTTARDLAAVKLAENFIGTPYVWGGASPKSGFDCSGLLQYVWGKQGVEIPRTTYEQFQAGTPVAKSNLTPGDAVYFTGSDPKNGLPGHVGMYIGNGKFVEAPHTGADVRVSSLAGRSDYVGARTFN